MEKPPLIGEHSECYDCPMLCQDIDGEDKCFLAFAGPLDDCTRAGIAHKMDEENIELSRQLADAKAEKETILKQATSMMIALRQVSGILWKIYDTLMDEGMQHDSSEIERQGRLLVMEGIDAISGVLKADALEDKQPCGHERRFIVSGDDRDIDPKGKSNRGKTGYCALCELQWVRTNNEALLDKMIISLQEE